MRITSVSVDHCKFGIWALVLRAIVLLIFTSVNFECESVSVNEGS